MIFNLKDCLVSILIFIIFLNAKPCCGSIQIRKEIINLFFAIISNIISLKVYVTVT